MCVNDRPFVGVCLLNHHNTLYYVHLHGVYKLLTERLHLFELSSVDVMAEKCSVPSKCSRYTPLS